MIDERFIFMVICVVLSPIAHGSSSFAGEIETFNFNPEHNKAIGFAGSRSEIALDLVTLPSSSTEELSPSVTQVPQHHINLKHDIDLHNSELILAQDNTWQKSQEKRELTSKPQAKTKKTESKLEKLNSQATTEETPKFSRRWSLIGMAITSLLSLTILWSLFKTEEQKQDQEAGSELVSMETQDSLELIDEETELFDEEPMISEKLPAITVLDSEMEPISNGNRKSSKSIEASNIDNYDSFDGHQPAARNTKDLLPKNIEPRVEANVVGGRGKIVTSNTTEIDVVFELIQDLQLRDRDLRRKAIWELAQTTDSRALDPLVNILSQVDALDKNLVLDAITQITFRNVKPINSALFNSLRDANSEVRKNAICDLVILYKPVSQITERLNQMLNDSDREVRQTAEWALKQFNQTSISSISQDFAKHG